MPKTLAFRAIESLDPDGALRIALEGEFDLLVADAVSLRLGQLKRDHAQLRIDLSAVDFIDSSGLRATVRAVGDGIAERAHRVELDPQVSEPVRRLLHLVGLDAMLPDGEVQ